MRIDDRDYTAMDLGERIRCLELNGYVVLPRWLDNATVEALRNALSHLPLAHTTYSEHQWYVHHVERQPAGASAHHHLGFPPLLELLTAILGDDIICCGATYARTDPGYPGMALHTDSQPYGSSIFGAQASSPVLLRVLQYLDDLTPDCAPLRVVPHSHVSLHSDANPYRRYRSHPEEVVVCAPAGSVVIINQRVFHAVGANRSSRSRRIYAVAYRPAWAGPVVRVELDPHAPALAETLPERVRTMFRDPNLRLESTTIQNWSEDLPSVAPGLGGGRWQCRGEHS